MTRPFAVAALLCLFLLPGCEDNAWWEYRDDPYIANLARQGEPEILRHVNASGKEERQMALRLAARLAGERRQQGNRAAADHLDEIVIRRYHVEKESDVRACIVTICAPMTKGSSAMVVFLRERIAAGEYPGYAALSLASLAPRNAVVDIEPLTRHPAHEVRLQAAVALTILVDPRGFDAVAKVWRGMQGPHWPDTVDGVPLSEARTNLGIRALRSFGRPLH